MQIYAPGNHRPSRLLTTFVALLYVFLSTFGVLTHATAHGDQASGTLCETTAMHERNGVVVHAFTAPCQCAFCGWLANSVSPALPIQHFDPPTTLAAPGFASPAVRPIAPRIFRASSRAPPHS